MVALAAGTLILGAPVLVATASVTAGARAASAADSAALAAADALVGLNAFHSGHGSHGGDEHTAADPCGFAAEIAALHDVVLHSCSFSYETLDARVEVRTRAGPFVLTRTARAGPPNTNALGSSHTHG